MRPSSKRPWLILPVLVVAVLAVLRSAGNLDFWQRYLSALRRGTAEPVASQIQPRILVRGAGESALPEATAEAEGIHPQGITDAIDTARQRGARALVVHRHGHRVAAWFADGMSGSAELAGGQLSPAFLVLGTGVLADSRQVEFEQAAMAIEALMAQSGEDWRNPWSATAKTRFRLSPPPSFLMNDVEGSLANTLSLRIWQPLGAGNAYLWGRDDSQLRLDCCAVARMDDWMRVGDLLLRMGEYEGTRIVSTDWMRHVLAIDEQGAAHPVWVTGPVAWSGDEPPAAREAYWFDLGPDVRLWLLPRRGLSILHWAAAGSDNSTDTAIPNLVIRAIVEQSTAPGATTNLNDIVPGH